MRARTPLQRFDHREEKRGEGLASAAARTIIGVLPTVAPSGARRPPPYLYGEDLTTTAT